MDISIFGTGYVGLFNVACLAKVGQNVVCTDVEPVKIEKLKKGALPIYEPSLEALVVRNVKKGRAALLNTTAHGVE